MQDRQSWLLNADERKKELHDRYGITPADFHEYLGTPGSQVNTLSVRMLKRPHGSEPAVRPPWRPAGPKAAAAATTLLRRQTKWKGQGDMG